MYVHYWGLYLSGCATIHIVVGGLWYYQVLLGWLFGVVCHIFENLTLYFVRVLCMYGISPLYCRTLICGL